MNSVVLSLHIALACGFISLFGFTGFAQASDVNSRLFLLQKTQLESNIRDLRKEQCIAIVQKNQAALSAVTRTLEGLKEDYQVALNTPPSVPPCYELLVGASTNNLNEP